MEDRPNGSPDAPPRALADRTDSSLLRRLRGGQQDAATELYLRYASRLRALVRGRCSARLAQQVEPDDIVQSVFRRFFRRVARADYDVPPGEELWGLLLVIALNKVRSEEAFHRAGKRDVRLLAPGSAEGAEAAEAEDVLLSLYVQDALAQLPELQRQLAEWRVQGHEVAEIAEKAGRSKRTVERLLQDVRARLRQLLGDVA
jgi:RNA polymerase sigma-70 factor (ECF subfamily)